jgi:hypothetical protein
MSESSIRTKAPNWQDLIGKTFGRWRVLSLAAPFFNCRCECGVERPVRCWDIFKGKSVSCGCLRVERAVAASSIHGQASRGKKRGIYNSWSNMLQRCNNPKVPCYEHYGARGISVDPRWLDYAAFYEDMGDTWKPGLKIERKDNSKGYSKDNCTWATQSEQMNNTRRNVNITVDGETLSIAEWARVYGVKSSMIRGRLLNGWNPVDAVTLPVGSSKP